jgi:small-conductance mechanosensitive channel
MKNVMKKVVYATTAIASAIPMIVSAQFSTPSGTGLPSGSITGIITNGMNWLLIMVGILGVIGFVIAGIIYLTAAGDETQIERGKQTMLASIIGVIVALIGVVIIRAVQGMLGGTSKNF